LYVTAVPFNQFPGFYDDSWILSQSVPRLNLEYFLREAASDLRRFLRAHFADELPRLSWDARVTWGNISHEIVMVAAEEQADLVVMAKRQRRGLFHLLSRSISEAVSREAACPVVSLCPPKVLQSAKALGVPFFGEAVANSGV
jgi:nucleotide-binding universal stress UspA family protein